jgi:N-succinyldiaminopimelate aminotransferase
VAVTGNARQRSALRLQTEMRDPLARRLQGFGTSVFAEMTALAVRTGAINLGQGFPDTDGPPAMLETAMEEIRRGANQYPPIAGVPELRQAVSRQRSARYGLDYDPEGEIHVTVGATEAIAASLLALAEPGDEVVVFEPFYDSYAAVIAMAGAVRRPVTLRPQGLSGRFTFDPDELRGAIGPRTKLLLVNSPHNPTGSVLTLEELELIAELCRDHDLVAITDEVYEYLTYDGAAHVPLATLPAMRERTVSISSGGKTFSATGWKVGWVMAPEPYVRAVQTAKQFLTFAVNAPYQRAVAYALEHELRWVEGLRADLEAKRDRLMEGLDAVGLTVHRPAGTYFVQADITPLGETDGAEFSRRLAEEAGVVAIPSQVFYDDVDAGRRFVRLAFCKQDAVIDEAVARLSRHGAQASGARAD